MFQKMPRKIFPPCQLIFRSLDAVVGLTAFEEATVLFSVGSNAEKKQYSNEPVKGLVAYVNGEVGQGNKIVFIELVSITARCKEFSWTISPCTSMHTLSCKDINASHFVQLAVILTSSMNTILLPWPTSPLT